jgi:geranylgeranyl diphosphate synthase type II
MAGAEAAGGTPAPWRALGEWLGEAYQVADDIRDVAADPMLLGKPIGRDQALGRPSMAAAHGLLGAVAHFHQLVERAAAAVPDCRGASRLRALVRAESERLVPAALCDQLARDHARAVA